MHFTYLFCHIHARVQESWAKLMPLQILQGGIQPWAPAGGGGARVGAQSAPPPLKKSRKFSSHYMHGVIFALFSPCGGFSTTFFSL